MARSPENNENELGGTSSPDNSASFEQPAESLTGGETATEPLERAVDSLNERGFPDAFSFPDICDVTDTVGFLDNLGLQSPLSLLDAFGVPDVFDFDNVADDIVGSITEELGDGNEFNDNVIGNNAAVLLTDDAQSTVNFLYVNPIQFFNDGRAGDIYLNISLDPDAELVVL